jgi:hypothetical protein
MISTRSVELLIDTVVCLALAKWETVRGLSQCIPPRNDLCSELDWELYLLDGGYFGRKNHGYCGVYRLIGLAAEGDIAKPVTLNRACGQDTTGTLYIGKSVSLHRRLNQLRLRQPTHNAIHTLQRMPRLQFPPGTLAIALYFTEVGMCSWIENDLIQAYINSFGDSPPLNLDIKLDNFR